MCCVCERVGNLSLSLCGTQIYVCARWRSSTRYYIYLTSRAHSRPQTSHRTQTSGFWVWSSWSIALYYCRNTWTVLHAIINHIAEKNPLGKLTHRNADYSLHSLTTVHRPARPRKLGWQDQISHYGTACLDGWVDEWQLAAMFQTFLIYVADLISRLSTQWHVMGPSTSGLVKMDHGWARYLIEVGGMMLFWCGQNYLDQ